MGLTGFTRFRASAAFFGYGLRFNGGFGLHGFHLGRRSRFNGFDGRGLCGNRKVAFLCRMFNDCFFDGRGDHFYGDCRFLFENPLVSSGTAIAFSANRKSTAATNNSPTAPTTVRVSRVALRISLLPLPSSL